LDTNKKDFRIFLKNKATFHKAIYNYLFHIKSNINIMVVILIFKPEQFLGKEEK